MNNIAYSYTDFINNRTAFKRVNSSTIAKFDSPAALYFKLFFYFTEDQGLLGANGMQIDNKTEYEDKLSKFTSAYKKVHGRNDEPENSIVKNVPYNTAYSYLLLNDETERAELLKEFVFTLSNISSDAPWYFQEIGGLDGALERKAFSDGEVKLEDTRKQITIKCLQDAYDNRIGTLLDLYRAACFSYRRKCEIVPANLRKFTMGIMLFNAPIRGKGGKSGDQKNKIKIPYGQENYYIPSVKYIEFRNCEFDYNSGKTAYGTVNAAEPLLPEYTISINFDDAYEVRYNEQMEKVITDFIQIDINGERSASDTSDINHRGTTNYDDEHRLRVHTGHTENEKAYWTDTNTKDTDDTASEAYKDKYIPYNGQEQQYGNAMTSQGPLQSFMNNTIDKAGSILSLPTIKNNENVHKYGTVTQYGKYEYLNKAAMGGIVGTVASQAAGTAIGQLENTINRAILGNIYKNSIAGIFSSASKVLSGDILGVVGDYTKKGTSGDISNGIGKKVNGYGEEAPAKETVINKKVNGYGDELPAKETVPENKDLHDAVSRKKAIGGQINDVPGKEDRSVQQQKLPQYNVQRTSYLRKYNEGKSIYNNL